MDEREIESKTSLLDLYADLNRSTKHISLWWFWWKTTFLVFKKNTHTIMSRFIHKIISANLCWYRSPARNLAATLSLGAYETVLRSGGSYSGPYVGIWTPLKGLHCLWSIKCRGRRHHRIGHGQRTMQPAKPSPYITWNNSPLVKTPTIGPIIESETLGLCTEPSGWIIWVF